MTRPFDDERHDLICKSARMIGRKVIDVRPSDGEFELTWADFEGNLMMNELLDNGRSKVTELELETMCFVNSDLLSHDALADIIGMAFKKAFNPDYLCEL